MTGRRTRNNRISSERARALAKGRGLYVYESAARQLEYAEPIDVELRRERQLKARKNREKAAHMNPGYVMFLALALSISAFVLMGYVRLKSDITASINHISVLENELNSLKHSNDEEYSRIENSVSLEEVKRVAIQELGMTYASEGQVVLYEAADADYVRQLEDIPTK